MMFRVAILASVLGAVVAHADAPQVPLLMSERVCSPNRTTCATIDRKRRLTTVFERGVQVWSAPVAPPAAAITDDARSLVELYRPGGLLRLEDGPETVVVVVRDRGTVVRELRVRDVIAKPAELRRTTSHRSWSRVDHLVGSAAYVIDTEEGRRIRIALPAGALTSEELSDGNSAMWFCRYAQPTTSGPCAGKSAERPHL